MSNRCLTLAILTLFVLAFTGILPLAHAQVLQKSELKYDDGTVEKKEAWPAGYMLAVRFTPPQLSLLRTLKFYVVSSPTKFEIHVLSAATHEDLITPFEFTPNPEFSYGWLVVDLPRRRIFPMVQEDFLVAVKFLSPYVPVLGADTSSPIAGRSEIYDGTQWSAYPVNMMIRADVVSISL